MNINYELLEVTWEDIIELAQNIFTQLKKKKIKVDTLVSVLRGGMPLALILGYNFPHANTACLHIRSSDTNTPNSSFSKPRLVGFTNSKCIEGKNILLVEDVVDSGKTIDLCTEILKKYKPKSIHVVTLYNFNSKRKDIIAGKEMHEYFWMVFPWETKLEVRKHD